LCGQSKRGESYGASFVVSAKLIRRTKLKAYRWFSPACALRRGSLRSSFWLAEPQLAVERRIYPAGGRTARGASRMNPAFRRQ